MFKTGLSVHFLKLRCSKHPIFKIFFSKRETKLLKIAFHLLCKIARLCWPARSAFPHAGVTWQALVRIFFWASLHSGHVNGARVRRGQRAARLPRQGMLPVCGSSLSLISFDQFHCLCLCVFVFIESQAFAFKFRCILFLHAKACLFICLFMHLHLFVCIHSEQIWIYIQINK